MTVKFVSFNEFDQPVHSWLISLYKKRKERINTEPETCSMFQYFYPLLNLQLKICEQTILTQVNLHLEYNKLYVGNKVYEDDAIADGFYDSIAALKQTTPNNLIFQLSSINGWG